MENKESVVGSLICSGSHLNRRIFNPEDPWLSVESTILAGNVTIDEESSNSNSKSNNDLTTVAEEKDNSTYPSIELEPIVDDNVLNMNIDAISDDDVFFDCATSPCPSPKKFFDSLNGVKSPRPKMKLIATPHFGQFLDVRDCVTASSSEATESSSSVEVGQRTGGLLVQIVDDFNDMKDHAQSTPKLDDTDSGYFQLPVKPDNSSRSGSDCSKGSAAKPRPPLPPKKSAARRKSPTYKPMSPVDPSNKENYYRGKYSRAVSGKPRTPMRPRRVAAMKEFFESRIMSESQQKPVVHQTSSIHYKTTLRKSPKVNDLRSFSSNEAGASRKKRSARSRPSSCSEISSVESSVSRATSTRSKSTSDATTDSSKERIRIQRMNNVAIRRYKMINQRTTLHGNSPKDSTIKKRRSFGLVVSPIKPVREIRKIFSPRFQGNKTETTKTKLKAPRIIYTNEK